MGPIWGRQDPGGPHAGPMILAILVWMCGVVFITLESGLLVVKSTWTPCTRLFRNHSFLHDRPSISPWIKSISNQLDITCHVFASQLSGHCDVIANRLWRHQPNVRRASETRGLCVKILVIASFMDSLCRVRNKIMYVLLWRTDYALTRVLFWCLFWYL